MSLKTAGGDTHFWTAKGSAVRLGDARPVGISAEQAEEYNAILSEILAGMGIKLRNPSRKHSDIEAQWRAESQKKVRGLIQNLGLPERFRIAKKAMQAAGIKNLPSSSDGLVVVFYSGDSRTESIASVSINTGNQKTGPTTASNATQSSCPNSTNNKSGYRCPLLGSGCYAEDGGQMYVTLNHNKAAGFNPKKDDHSTVPPDEVAEAEAKAIRAAYPTWELIQINNGFRLHVVGDCVTSKAARIVSDAIDPYVRPSLAGIGTKSDAIRKNVWNYTHAWRDVPRSAWHPSISVLASCDRIEDLDHAHEQGYGCCVVVPDYVQNEAGKYVGKAMPLSNGWKLIPCPYEVDMKNEKGTDRVWCIECGLCMKDDLLRKNRAAIAFAAHTGASKEVTKKLISIEEILGGKK